MIQIVPVIVLQLLRHERRVRFLVRAVVRCMEPVPILVIEAGIRMPRPIPRHGDGLLRQRNLMKQSPNRQIIRLVVLRWTGAPRHRRTVHLRIGHIERTVRFTIIHQDQLETLRQSL